MTDPALELGQMYRDFCEQCLDAGLPVPTIDEWIARIEERIVERRGGGVAPV